MANIYRSDDEQGYGFAFDTAGNEIDWQPVAKASQRKAQRLVLSLAMLFTEDGEIRKRSRIAVEIPQGSTDATVRQRVYAAIRHYIRTVANQLGFDGDATPADTVALLSSVNLQ